MISSQCKDDVSRLFRDNDTVGSDSSLWLRPLRQLFADGKPVGGVLGLMVSEAEDSRLPFGMVTKTESDRLVFWPVLPPGVTMNCSDTLSVVDHVTLELPSEKIHLTGYDTNNQRVHVRRGWRMRRFTDCPLACWFTMLVRVAVLRKQERAVQRRLIAPTVPEKARREKLFLQYTHNFRISSIALPPHGADLDYIYFGIYVGPSTIRTDQLSPHILPVDASLQAQVEGWLPDDDLRATFSQASIGDHTIWVGITCPSGKLRSDVSIGLPGRVDS